MVTPVDYKVFVVLFIFLLGTVSLCNGLEEQQLSLSTCDGGRSGDGEDQSCDRVLGGTNERVKLLDSLKTNQGLIILLMNLLIK